MEIQTLPTYEEFEQEALADSKDEVLVREWAPLQVVPTHTHPFAANATVSTGEMWLTPSFKLLSSRPLAGNSLAVRPGQPRSPKGRHMPEAMTQSPPQTGRCR